MIEIKNLKKVYISNDKTEVLALNDISFILPNKGMFFIVGKSGCGKTTLLNLLGGIDKATSGNILIDGKAFSDFSEKDFNVYRANYLGFVFQNYNLISNLSVKDNLAFSSALTGVCSKEEKIDEILKIVDLQTYTKHLPQEMSCGQQQRVAIGRAMLKKPKLVLADEPTGNLDSDTSRDIFDWLKNISQNTLVVVVTHDLENAEKYGDGIIELLDGKIIRTTTLSLNNNVKITPLPHKIVGLPLKSALNFALKNMRFKIFLRTVAILLCILAISQVGYMQSVVDYNVQTSIAETMSSQNINNFTLEKYNAENNEISTQEFLNLSEQYEKTNFYKLGTNLDFQIILIEKLSDIEKFGFSLFDGFFELDKNSVYLADGAADKLIKSQNPYYIYENESFQIIESISKIKGGIYKEPNLSSHFINVAGLINTNYQHYAANFETLNTREKEIYGFLSNYVYGANNLIVFGSEEFLKNNEGIFEVANIGLHADEETKIIKQYSLLDYAKNSMQLKTKPVYFKDCAVHDKMDFVLNEDEIIIPLKDYNILFGTTYFSNNFFSFFDEVIPPEKEPEFDLAINLSIEKEQAVFFNELKIVGFSLDPLGEELQQSNDNRVIISTKLLDKIKNNLDVKIQAIYGITNYKSEMEKLLKENTNFHMYAPYSAKLYEYERLYLSQKSSYLGLNLTMIIIAIALFYYVISSTIGEQKKNIGIIRSMGASRTDILKIYFIECAFIALIITIISSIITIPAIIINNISVAKKVIEGAIIYKVTYSVILELFLIPIATIFLSALLPLTVLYRKKPIDLIKDFN